MHLMQMFKCKCSNDTNASNSSDANILNATVEEPFFQ